MSKSKKPLVLIIVGIIILVIILLAVFIPKGDAKPTGIPLSNTILAPKDIQSIITADGIVASNLEENIYAEVSYPVNEVIASVGDIVKAGDVLCQIDKVELEKQIAQKEANMESSNINTYYQLSQSQKKYNEAKNNLENGLNVELSGASTALKSAEYDMKIAKERFDDAQSNLSANNNAELLELKSKLENDEITLAASKETYFNELENNPEKYNEIYPMELTLSMLKDKLNAAKDELLLAQGKDADTIKAITEKINSAQKNYDQGLSDIMSELGGKLFALREIVKTNEDNHTASKSEFDALIRANGGEISQIKQTLNSAELQYDSALTTYEATKLSTEQQLSSLKNEMDKNAETVANDASVLELANLKDKLEDCTVKAPANGVVTSVNITKGATAQGLLFTIEDTRDLKIKATVKEYDIGSIAAGMKVLIKSDATGDEEYEGVITKIAPTASKDSADTVFDIEVDVVTPDTELLIGLTAKLRIVTVEKKAAYSVQYDAITVNDADQDIIYIANPESNGSYKAKEVVVTVGLETDFEIEILSDEISDGTIILTDIERVQDGTVVRLKK